MLVGHSSFVVHERAKVKGTTTERSLKMIVMRIMSSVMLCVIHRTGHELLYVVGSAEHCESIEKVSCLLRDGFVVA